jgi:hypothetical protein
MNFYPVYRLRGSNGSFSRVGTLLETYQQMSTPITPHILKQAVVLFEQAPGDKILVGPRCVSIGSDPFPEKGE